MTVKIEERVEGIDKRIEALLKSQEEFRKGEEKFHEEFREAQRKTDEQIDRLTEDQKKTEDQLKKTSKEVGKVSDSIGRFAEGLVAPSISKLFLPLGIKITQAFPRACAIENGETKAEIDLLCSGSRNGKRIAFVGEIKTRLSSEYVREFIDVLTHFREFFPEYKEAEIIGFVAGMTVEDNAKRYAERKGLYVLAPEEDMIQILNKQGFKPKNW
ncbi:MAG: hypothetical protein AB1797_02595 [bacterium]